MATAKRAKNINKADAGEPSDDQSISQNELTRAEIEKRAYAIYLSRGEVHGYDQDDWLQAERELNETQS